MGYIIGIIIIVIILFIASSFMRKKVYDAVDKLEAWKISIMERDINNQLSEIKSLNLLGETLERFESWKQRWDDINTKGLSDLEDYLFEAESAADRYRFTQARKIIHKAENHLKSIEEEISSILTEFNELMDSEQKGRLEIEEVEPTVKKLRRKLSQNRYQYGKAESVFEERIDQLQKRLKKYNELTEAGDYIEAKNLAELMKKDCSLLSEKMKEFPKLLKVFRFELPQSLEELKSGMKDMIEEGYHIKHLGFFDEIHSYEKKIEESLKLLEKADISTAESLQEDINERLGEMYNLLEKEAIAKNFIETQMPNYQSVLNEIGASFKETKKEVEEMKQAYYFEDRDLEKYLSLEKMLTHLRSQLQEMEEEIANQTSSHSELREELEKSFQELEDLKQHLQKFHERIHMLRKDEIDAKEKLDTLRLQLKKVRRDLKKSNLPGIPNFLWTLIEESDKTLTHILETLEAKPLEIIKVQEVLENGESKVKEAIEATELILEQAYLTEKVIQYANRYRSQNKALAEDLTEAERLFRKFEYELALEHAAKAVETVEPGALSRIEQLVDEIEEKKKSLL